MLIQYKKRLKKTKVIQLQIEIYHTIHSGPEK